MSGYPINKYREKSIYKNYEIMFSDLETIIDEISYKHKVISIGLIRENGEELIFDSMDSYMDHILKIKRGKIIYFHNLGRFDSTFILNWFVEKENTSDSVEIIERNNIIYEIKIKESKTVFRDSYLLIPESLDNIGKTFCDNFSKDNFDYKNMNNIWINDRKKIHDLCINDCRVLKEGFENFSLIIKNKFDIDLYKQLTLPSLAFNIFKKIYYDVENKPINKNNPKYDSFIRESYAGGISEVFKPHLKNGYCYDANSLYPYVMKINKFPIGKPRIVEGDKINIENFIGFIKCRVFCDKEINFLTYRHETKGLITPIGTWVQTYYHAEVKKAIELGYKLDFIKGVQYDYEDFIFDGYVENLYNMRINSDSKPLKKITKLLLNSLYGRFGMKLFKETTKFITRKQVQKLKSKYDITNINYLGNDIFTVACKISSIDEKQDFKNTINTETAVQIASAVTSYARCYMYKFKNLEDNNCFYTDTDSIFLEKPLDEKYIGDKLGMFKLEYEIEEAYFVAPKVYYVKKKDGEHKVVVKGLKKNEISNDHLWKTFESLVEKSEGEVNFERTSNFKRNLEKFIMYVTNTDIKFKFPFNKRKKIYEGKKWINTKPLKLRNL